MAPEPKTTTKFISSNNANSFKAAIFHTPTFKLSLEINTDQVTTSTKRSLLYSLCKIKKKNSSFEQYARLYLDGPEIAICETASNIVFVLNSSFTTKNEYIRVAIAEACDAFNKMLLHFGCTQNIEIYDPKIHKVNPPQTHPFCYMDFSSNIY